MTASARERLTRLLGAAPATPSSVRLSARARDLHLTVDGVGVVELPVPAERARELCRIGSPASFGRGEQTLTDPEVRDTWEVPRDLVRVEWTGKLAGVLDEVRDRLGMPSSSELVAELHSMLVYEPGQFFLAHQDSEKDDAMVATLVLTLPSAHTGGEFVVEDNGEVKTYRGSKSSVSVVAFYADCRHEVRPVRSGHRVTVTYNLLLRADAGRPERVHDETTDKLASCLDEHFTTPVTKPYLRGDAVPPNRLVYLLDHEYTARALGWPRLKGVDVRRAALLRTAAEASECEAVLALADVQETWNAYDPDDSPYGDGDWHGDIHEPDEPGGPEEYELQDLVDSSVRLTRWTDADGAVATDVSLFVDDAEVCAVTRSVDLTPYESHHEGYMGNYGNTMDRWYRRAAVVVWPRDRAFTNRAEASPAWALDELRGRVRGGDLAGARAAARTLESFWPRRAREDDRAGFVGSALRTAVVLDDAEIARMLLSPLRLESMRRGHAAPLAKLATRYGETLLPELLRDWIGEERPWGYAQPDDRLRWLGSLPGLCEALVARGEPGAAVAQRLLRLCWDWLARTAMLWQRMRSPSRRDAQLTRLGKPLAALLAAAATADAADLRDEVARFVDEHGDALTACVLATLRAGESLPRETRRAAGFDDLATRCAARLRRRLDRPPRPDDDWSIELPDGCACERCGTLGAFLRDPARRRLEWPIAKDYRRHVHVRIDEAELPIDHVTRRQGRPFTLVLTKSPVLFERERRARARDEADLARLTAEWEVTRARSRRR